MNKLLSIHVYQLHIKLKNLPLCWNEVFFSTRDM